MHGNELQLFGATPSHTINVTNVSEIAAVDTTFNILSYNAVWVENLTNDNPDDVVRMRYLSRYGRRGYNNMRRQSIYTTEKMTSNKFWGKWILCFEAQFHL